MAAPTIDDLTAFQQDAATATLVVSLPGGLLVDDLLLLATIDTPSAALVPPAGWSEFTWSPRPAGVSQLRAFWRVVDDSDGPDIELDKTAADSWIGVLLHIVDNNPISPILIDGGISNASGPDAGFPGLPLGLPDSLLVWFADVDGGPDFTTPTGFDEQSHGQLANNWAFGSASAAFPDPGFSGPVTAPLAGNSASAIGLIAVRANSLHIAPLLLNDGTVGTPYTMLPPPVGVIGTPDYSYLLIGGSIPPGITMMFGPVHDLPYRRVIFGGTPTAPGFYPFQLRVIDSLGATFDQNFSINVLPEPIILTGNAAIGRVGVMAPGSSSGITGNAAAGAVGLLTTSVALALIGHAAPGIVGVLAPMISTSVSGNAAAGSVGTLVPDNAPALVGQAAVGAVGALTSSRTVGLLGVAATGALGRLWPPFTSDPNYVVRYVYRNNVVPYNPWRGATGAPTVDEDETP